MASLQKDAVVDTWGAVIPKQSEKAERIYHLVNGAVTELIKTTGEGPWRNITVERKDISGVGGVVGMFAEKRNRMIVKWHDYKIYVCARPYGSNLDVSWNLTFEPGLFKTLTQIDLSSLNAFQLEDLRAFVTVIHRTVTEAVDLIMQEAGLDSAKLNKTSKGFLGVS